MSDYHENPAKDNQKDGHVNIVDEEACLTCSLKTPIHSIRTKKLPWLRGAFELELYLLGISYFILYSWRDKIFSLIGYFLIRWSIKENKNSPKSDSFIKILRLNLI
jgi:hypothetical protein